MCLRLKSDFVVKSYLYRSVYNELLNQERDRKFIVQLDKEYTDALSQIVEENNEKSLEKLMTLVKREIAEYLNVSIKSVEAHIAKAFTKLHKTVGGKIESILFLLFGLNNRVTYIRNYKISISL